MIEPKYEDLPIRWAVCFLDQCSRKDECLRYKAARTLPDGEYTAYSVVPAVLRQKKCPCFHPIEIVRTAVGFENIFRNVKARHASSIRSDIASFLHGNGTYYRYLHGKRRLMPEQQKWIRQLFKDYGYTDDIEFDGYQDCLRFYDT